MILRQGEYLQNRYEILTLIGSGGMSEVYRAHCHKLNREVAIKVLKKEFCSDEEFVRKFKMEAQAAGALNHPNIVNIYDVVDEEALHYIVMELVDGITLKEYIRKKGRLDIREAIDLAVQVAKGIGAAHQRQIVHRDVKPQNMILSKDEKKVKVADFGIARAVTSQTVSSQAVGSVHYISPEQAKGEFTDERSDIYSLGITLYEMVTGKLPFTGDTAVSIALAHIESEITPPGAYNPAIPAGLERIILKCTEKEPEDRYQNVSELIADLRALPVQPGAENGDASGRAAQPEGGGTRVISRQEVSEIRRASGHPRTPAKVTRKETAEELADAGLNRLLKTVGIVLAAAVVIGAIVLLSMFSGLLRHGVKPEESTAENAGESTISEKEVYIPYIIGLTQAEAEKKLAESGLTLKIAAREHSDQFAEDMVMGQTPQAGDVIARYSKVEAILSLGSEQIALSDLKLTEMNAEDAETVLKERGFSVTREEASSDTVAEGMVIAVAPEKAEAGDTVRLTVSSGPEKSMTLVPNLIGDSEEAAKQKLTAAGLISGTVGRVNSETVVAGIVLFQGTDAGSSVLSGTAVDYVLSAGPAEGSTPAETYYHVEPIGGNTDSRYVASINTTYELANLIGPGSATTSVTVMIRLRQELDGQTYYQTLMDARTVTADTILPVRFKSIEGMYGVDTGHVEIVRSDTDTVLQSYEVQFFKVQ